MAFKSAGELVQIEGFLLHSADHHSPHYQHHCSLHLSQQLFLHLHCCCYFPDHRVVVCVLSKGAIIRVIILKC